MTWVIELDVDEVEAGPGHGELMVIVTDAIRERHADLVKHARVRWRDEGSLDDAVAGLIKRLTQRALSGMPPEQEPDLLLALLTARNHDTDREAI